MTASTKVDSKRARNEVLKSGFKYSVSVVVTVILIIATSWAFINYTKELNIPAWCIEGPGASKVLPAERFMENGDHRECQVPVAAYLCSDNDVWRWGDAECRRMSTKPVIAWRGCLQHEWDKHGKVPDKVWNCFYYRGSSEVKEDFSRMPGGWWFVLGYALAILTGIAVLCQCCVAAPACAPACAPAAAPAVAPAAAPAMTSARFLFVCLCSLAAVLGASLATITVMRNFTHDQPQKDIPDVARRPDIGMVAIAALLCQLCLICIALPFVVFYAGPASFAKSCFQRKSTAWHGEEENKEPSPAAIIVGKPFTTAVEV